LISVLDLFRVGIGPSSSHTVGPMRIARRFVEAIAARGHIDRVVRVHVELQGSLALTGPGHGSVTATILGLLGHDPESVDPAAVIGEVERVRASGALSLHDGPAIPFDIRSDIDLAGHIIPDLHPNGMRLRAFDLTGAVVADDVWYSTGGGFVATARQLEAPLVCAAPGRHCVPQAGRLWGAPGRGAPGGPHGH
jgi:L-serine dehydratase